MSANQRHANNTLESQRCDERSREVKGQRGELVVWWRDRGSVPANRGGFGQTSGGRQRLGASDWRRVRRRNVPQQHGDRRLIGGEKNESENKKKAIKETETGQSHRNSRFQHLKISLHVPRPPELPVGSGYSLGMCEWRTQSFTWWLGRKTTTFSLYGSYFMINTWVRTKLTQVVINNNISALNTCVSERPCGTNVVFTSICLSAPGIYQLQIESAVMERRRSGTRGRCWWKTLHLVFHRHQSEMYSCLYYKLCLFSWFKFYIYGCICVA